MKKSINLFIALLICFHINAQEDIQLSGLVIEQNSKFNTGEVNYLSDVKIKSAGATPQLSDNQGSFALIFAAKPVGNITRVFTSKTGYKVVNNEVLRHAVVLGRKKPLKVVMCKTEVWHENKIIYHNIVKEAYQETYNERIAILEKEGKERDRLIAQMEREFDQKIKTIAQANELLLRQLHAAQKHMTGLANKWLTINLDDQSEIYQEAYRQFLDKDIDGALKILEQVNLEERLAKQQLIGDTLQKNLQQDIELCLFKAELHQLKYQFDKAEEMYELALKYNSENPEILFEYNRYLYAQNQLNKVNQLYVETIDRYRQLAQNNPQNYLPDVAKILNNFGIVQSLTNELKQAEKSFEEALEIYRQLVQDNPQTYLPDVAATLNYLGNLQREKNELEQAEKSFEEALKIYRQLAQDNPQSYLSDMVGILNNLGDLQRDKNELKQAEKSYKEALEIYRQSTQEIPYTYLPDIANALNELAILQNDRNELEQAEKSYKEV